MRQGWQQVPRKAAKHCLMQRSCAVATPLRSTATARPQGRQKNTGMLN